MKTALKWFAVLNSAAGLAIAQQQFFPFILFLGATLIITPPFRSAIAHKMPIFKIRGTTGLAWLCLYLFAWFLWSPIDPHIKHLEAQKNVGALIQIVQQQDDNANQAARALGNIGDKQAVAPLIKTIEDSSTTSRLRESSVDALGKLQDSEAVIPLGKLLSSGSTDTVNKAKSALKSIAEGDRLAHRRIILDLADANPEKVQFAKQVLVSMGLPAVADTLEMLKVSDPKHKPVIMETLGEIGDLKAIGPLSKYLTDWDMKSFAGKALEKLNWQPESDRDQVRYWVALGRRDILNEKWKMTKRVLMEHVQSSSQNLIDYASYTVMEEVQSSNRSLIDYALYAFITIGNKEVIPDLVSALHNQESQEMALAYLNCGEPTLESAARTWGRDRGYEVIKTKNTSGRKVAWGTLKN